MPQTLDRPADLPDFAAPPLNEVVLGVQFSQPEHYQAIQAFQVWELFKRNYPKTQEQLPLSPAFEMFGLSKGAVRLPQIQFETGVMPSRHWFLSDDGSTLIQFQADRLLHNWRKNPNSTASYPRHEAMIQEFQKELEDLENFMHGISGKHLEITQVEISYINHIKLIETSEHIDSYLNFLSLNGRQPDDIAVTVREVIKLPDGTPIGRFHCEVANARNVSHEDIFAMSLTVRGAPAEPTIASALEFLALGRETICKNFVLLTTPHAHDVWGLK